MATVVAVSLFPLAIPLLALSLPRASGSGLLSMSSLSSLMISMLMVVMEMLLVVMVVVIVVVVVIAVPPGCDLVVAVVALDDGCTALGCNSDKNRTVDLSPMIKMMLMMMMMTTVKQYDLRLCSLLMILAARPLCRPVVSSVSLKVDTRMGTRYTLGSSHRCYP